MNMNLRQQRSHEQGSKGIVGRPEYVAKVARVEIKGQAIRNVYRLSGSFILVLMTLLHLIGTTKYVSFAY